MRRNNNRLKPVIQPECAASETKEKKHAYPKAARRDYFCFPAKHGRRPAVHAGLTLRTGRLTLVLLLLLYWASLLPFNTQRRRPVPTAHTHTHTLVVFHRSEAARREARTRRSGSHSDKTSAAMPQAASQEEITSSSPLALRL